MDLSAYLDRIGFRGTPRPDLPTLQALHRAHQYTVPFEDLDVQLGRPVAVDVEWSFEKIVRRRRGGWCYEMNGLMGWALREIGFDVTRMSAGVRREQMGDVQLGNHLCLMVRLEQPYLVDVGFGGTLAEPLPLREIERRDEPYRLTLRQTPGDYWRFTEEAGGEPFSFDFLAAPADEALIARKCIEQQTSPSSTFVQNLVVQRRGVDEHVSLRGRVLSTIRSRGTDKLLLSSPDELVMILRQQFDLDVPEAATLWPAICARHDARFPSTG
jgi:N-hydroxyarylamine O-acetyltransferase